MNILAVTPYYVPEGGGLERYAHEILRRLAARGHDVRAMAFSANGAAAEVRNGVLVRRFSPLVRLGTAPLHPDFGRHVANAIRRFRPDVLVAHTPVPFPAEAAVEAARSNGVPTVVTYHAGRLHGSSVALEGLAAVHRATLERRMLARADRLIAPTPYVRDHALRTHRDRVTIIPPGVDTARFRPAGNPDPATILYVGALDTRYRWKGLDTLLAAMARVRKSVPGARLTLVGDGDRYAEIARKARAHPSAIQLAGRLSQAELARHYQRATVVTLPSTTDAESFGMVLAEANACARPVVASRIGGIPDFVRHGDNGLLARPGDPADLAQMILRLLQDPDLANRLGRNGHARVAREHSWDDLTAATERVIEQATGHDSTPPQPPRTIASPESAAGPALQAGGAT